MKHCNAHDVAQVFLHILVFVAIAVKMLISAISAGTMSLVSIKNRLNPVKLGKQKNLIFKKN